MGWPKGRARGPRKLTDPLREPAIEAARDAADDHSVIRGRDGEILSRKRRDSSDIFFIPEELKDPNWDLQWNTVTVYEQPQTAQVLAMRENGWRPVPAGRFKGMFMPADYPDDGEILRDGMRLEERPIELTEQAKADEYAKATGLMSNQQEQLGLVKKLPPAFASSQDNPTLRRMEKAGTSRTYAPEPGVARPRLPIEN